MPRTYVSKFISLSVQLWRDDVDFIDAEAKQRQDSFAQVVRDIVDLGLVEYRKGRRPS